MVDLAKIRKKARKGAGGGAQGADEKPPEPTGLPAVESSSGPGSSTTRRLDDSTARRLDDSTTRRLDDSTTRRLDDSPAPPPDVPALQEAEALRSDKLEKFKAEAGQRRVARVEQVVEAKEQLELLTFLIAGEQYAIEIEKIVEIVTQRPITRIPNADASVVGIISLRGTIVTLVDVRRKLRHPAATEENGLARIVVIDMASETIGFVVDRVLRVVKIAPSEVEPHPVVHSTELEEAVRGVFRVAGALTILLDLDKLLDHSQWT